MNLKKKLLFTKKLQFLYKSGKPLMESLEYLSIHEKSKYFRDIFNDFAKEIKAGGSLYSAFTKKEDLFGQVYCKLVNVGESSGRLEIVLEKLIELIENSIAIRNKIISASIYPVVLVVVYLLIFLVVFNVSVFMLSKLFETLNSTPPTILVILKGLQSIIFSLPGCCFGSLLLVFIAVFIFLLLNLDHFNKIRYIILSFIPAFGQLEKLKQLYTYIFTFKICYESGLTTMEASSLATEGVDNDYLFDKFVVSYNNIVEGSTLSSSLKKTNLFEHEWIELIRTGEESGRIDESLVSLLKQIDDKIKQITIILLALIKPLGVIMGVLFLLLFLLFIGAIIVSILANVFNKI